MARAAGNPMAEDTAPPLPGMEGSAPAMEPGEDEPDAAGSIITNLKNLGGKENWKKGDQVMFDIKDIDPESGDVELVYSTDGGSKPGPSDSMEAMDRAMPPSDEGGY